MFNLVVNIFFRKRFNRKTKQILMSILFGVLIFDFKINASKQIFKQKATFDDDEIDHGEVVRGERSEERINLSVPGVCLRFIF